jgi:hypothetical protein
MEIAFAGVRECLSQTRRSAPAHGTSRRTEFPCDIFAFSPMNIGDAGEAPRQF